MSYETQYFKDVFSVLQRLHKLSFYSLVPNKVEYRIKVENSRSLEPMEEWKIVKQLVSRGVVTEYEESDTFEAQVGKTALVPEFIFYLEIIPEKFSLYLAEVKNQIQSVKVDDLVDTPWPAEYKWLTEKIFQAKTRIIFNESKSNRTNVFKLLVQARGNWVSSKDLIELLSIKTSENLRSVISQMRKSISGSGLEIVPRRESGRGSAYRIKP